MSNSEIHTFQWSRSFYYYYHCLLEARLDDPPSETDPAFSKFSHCPAYQSELMEINVILECECSCSYLTSWFCSYQPQPNFQYWITMAVYQTWQLRPKKVCPRTTLWTRVTSMISSAARGLLEMTQWWQWQKQEVPVTNQACAMCAWCQWSLHIFNGLCQLDIEKCVHQSERKELNCSTISRHWEAPSTVMSY